MKMTGIYKTPLHRITAEGALINKELENRSEHNQVIIMNSKSDFHQPKKIRIKPQYMTMD